MCLEGSQPQQKKSKGDSEPLRCLHRVESGVAIKHGVGESDFLHRLRWAGTRLPDKKRDTPHLHLDFR